MRQDLCDLLVHRSKQPLGFFVERHPHRMKLGHLLCNLCRNAGVTQLTGVQFTALSTGFYKLLLIQQMN